MRPTARAPGKLVFLGEYAVVDGAPAVVAAIDRFAHAKCRRAGVATWRVSAANLAGAAVRFRPGVDPAPEGPLHLACTLLNVMADDDALDVRVSRDIALDSSELFAAGGKLGLGSSAAVLASLHRMLDERATPAVAFGRIDAAHRRAQKGLGSGVDVAAAVTGGLLVFTRGEPPAIEPVCLPENVHWVAIYTGVSVSTAKYLAAVHRWRRRDGPEYIAHRDALGELAERGARALRDGDGAAFCAVAGDYGRALGRFGRAAGVDIESMEHTALADVAQRNGVQYKVSGAGGGDVGLAFSTQADRLSRFCARVPAVDPRFRVLSLELAPTSWK